MLFLLTLLEKPSEKESLRTYQRDRWGRLSGGETCVIELSGLAANSSRVRRERELFRQERIEIIRHRMLTYKPTLVVMYGKKEKNHWEKIAGGKFPADGILRLQSTTLTFTKHPTSHGLRNSYWVNLGKRLHQEPNGS
jgi:hypothetical protein